MTTLLTKKQTAAMLGISPRQVDRLCRLRRLPFAIVGSRKRFDPARVADWLAARTFDHPSPPQDSI